MSPKVATKFALKFRMLSWQAEKKACYGAQGAEGILGEFFLLKHLEDNSGSRFMVRSGLLSALLGLA